MTRKPQRSQSRWSLWSGGVNKAAMQQGAEEQASRVAAEDDPGVRGGRPQDDGAEELDREHGARDRGQHAVVARPSAPDRRSRAPQ